MKPIIEAAHAACRPHWWLVLALVLVTAPGTAMAQKKGKRSKPAPAAKEQPAAADGKPKVFDFTGMDLSGRLRTPQLLYFLDRASEELKRASLERRSFLPELVRSVDEEAL